MNQGQNLEKIMILFIRYYRGLLFKKIPIEKR